MLLLNWSTIFLTTLLKILAILHISDGILNRNPNGNTEMYKAGSISDTASGSVYLNSKRPLWILEDQVQRQDIDKIRFTTTTRRPIYNPYYFNSNNKRKQHKPQPQSQQKQQKQHRNAPSHRYRFKLPQRLQLPSHYISLDQNRGHQVFRHSRQHQIPIRRQNYQLQQEETIYGSSMPIFDSLPGDDNAEAMPIFIYNGPKGELILNTMLSARKYPMQEPVPGQILYPPSAPIFRPKPIVERFRVPGRSKTLNLTLIPFYAHEAIDPRSLNQQIPAYDNDVAIITSETPLPPPPPPAPTVLYSSPVVAAEKPKMKKRRHKKAKEYSVYHSPNDVQWRPTEATLELMTPSTTPFPLALASPLQNHRYVAGSASDMDMDMDIPTTSKPLNNFKLTYKDEEDQFQIVYVDESLEKPSAMVTMPTKSPLLSSRYAIAKEYYAFPVYTLGKLLKPDTEKSMNFLTDHAALIAEGQQKENIQKDNTDTWFILNSRYKGNRKHNENYRLSSKYIQNAAHEPSARSSSSSSSSSASVASSETARVNDNEFVA